MPRKNLPDSVFSGYSKSPRVRIRHLEKQKRKKILTFPILLNATKFSNNCPSFSIVFDVRHFLTRLICSEPSDWNVKCSSNREISRPLIFQVTFAGGFARTETRRRVVSMPRSIKISSPPRTIVQSKMRITFFDTDFKDH